MLNSKVRLDFKIEHQNKSLLILIKQFLGGNIRYCKIKDIYYYDSTNLGSAKKVINYFDNYHLLSSKHINYLKWRKVYIFIQNKEYLTDQILERIIKFKYTMNRGNTLEKYKIKKGTK